jgi:transposase
MEYAAIDLHKRESQVRIISERGEICDQRIQTTRERFMAVFWGRPSMRILVEASTESEWVAQQLESFGHEVVVADPNYAPMYGHRSRRVKTDRRDAAALAEACRLGIYRPAHRRSAQYASIHAQLVARDQLVRTRTRTISVIRAVGRGAGLRIRSGESETFLTRLNAFDLPPSADIAVTPLRQVIATTNEQVAVMDRSLAMVATQDPVLTRLMTFPGIGPITACAFVAALDDVTRFRGAGQVTCYLGLVPREYSSGERQRRGHVLRSAHPRVQSLLVQAAWRIWRSTRADTAHLRTWAYAISQRRGRRVAVVALARRVARILFAMWRDGSIYRLDRKTRKSDVTVVQR